jgi:hypothetical protein
LPDDPTIEEEIIRYVLGQLSEEEERSIEDQYALNLDFSDLVNAVEDDLVVAYVLNRLAREQREQFERFFLASPENVEKVTFTEALLRHMQQDSPGKISPAATQSQANIPSAGVRNWNALASRFALAFIILMAIGSGLWFLTRNNNSLPPVNQERLPTPLSQNGVKQAEPTSEPSPNNQAVISTAPERNAQPFNRQATTRSKRTTGEKTTPIIASFILSPGITRAPGDTNRIEIPKNAQLVRLQLSMDTSVAYVTYEALLKQVGGREIWTHRIRNRSGKRLRSLTLSIPANLLSSGEYIITLGGTMQLGKAEILADYSLLVADAK